MHISALIIAIIASTCAATRRRFATRQRCAIRPVRCHQPLFRNASYHYFSPLLFRRDTLLADCRAGAPSASAATVPVLRDAFLSPRFPQLPPTRRPDY